MDERLDKRHVIDPTIRKRANSAPVLTLEAEQELFARVSVGDMAARDQIVESNLRHVVSLSILYSRRSRVGAEELLASGCLGLLRAIEKYDPGRGLRFVTYAAHWIKCFIRDTVLHLRSIAKTDWRTPDVARDMSLDDSDTPEGATRKDLLVDGAPSQEQTFADDEALSRVRWIAEGVIRREMNPRERVIARSRVMGSNQEECPSLRDLAAEFGCTPECIRLIEMKARAKIMHALTKAGVGA